MPKVSKKQENTGPKPIFTYGFRVNEAATQLDYDRAAFSDRIQVDRGVPSRYELFRKIAEQTVPGHFEWHDWTIKMVKPLCGEYLPPPQDPQRKTKILLAFPGCASSGKTFNVTGFGMNWWLCNPLHSSVTVVSTTLKSLRRRAWNEVRNFYGKLPGSRFGNFIDSKLIWQAKKGDDRNAVIGKAIEEGPIQKVADDIKGVHTRRQMVIVDEATSVPEAILEACSNLYGYPDEFILVLLGNPFNRMDQFGSFCEPEDGWLSVTVDTPEWDAKPFEKCGGLQPRVVRFDAELSPNILNPDKLVSRHLPTKEGVEAARRAGGGQTPSYWQNYRGFWPPEGLITTVFTESSILKFKGGERHKFTGRNFSIVGSFDPAYGGDRAVLRFAKLGEIVGAKWGIELLPPIIIPVDARSTNPVHYQLSEQVRRQCEKVIVNDMEYSCPPENLCVDDTGEGGLCDIFYRTWSTKIIRIEFGGRASTDPCSIEDMRPANEVYENKRAEMYFRGRDALNSEQLKGIDRETAIELCSIEFDSKRRKLTLISKKDYKAKYKKSPDLADTAAMMIEIARLKGFALAPVGETVHIADDAEAEAKAAQDVYEDTYQEEELEAVESMM